MNQIWTNFKANVSTPMVVSSALGAALLGFVVFLLNQTGIGFVKKAAKVAKDGK